jgi:hypothetical protein
MTGTMADWIARITQGNVAEVKTVLTSVAFALAGYQVVLAAIGQWHHAGRFLPVLGTTEFVLLALTWLTSAGSFLADS